MFNLSNFQRRDNSKVLTFFATADTSQIFTYADLYSGLIKLSECLRTSKNDSTRGFNVAILLPVHSPALLPAIVGIENTDGVCCFLNSTESVENIKSRLIDFKANVIICDLQTLYRLNADDERLKITSEITLFNVDCAVVEIENARHDSNESIANDYDDKLKSSEILFYATTSGSCGEVKHIGVTYKCFKPNIISLGKLYDINENDVFLVSSPPTFDPFMVDICLALHYGASLIMITNNLRCDSRKLLNILFPEDKTSEVTIMQLTPSLFMRWSSTEISNRIFSKGSKLRILAFGGEAFPSTNAIKNWTDWEKNNSTRIFNLYGLTEMSCWASICEITKDDILSNRKISIGQSLDEHTTFEISTDGELLLKSKVRKCFQSLLTDDQVIDENFEFILRTGDLVEVGNESQFYFTSRSNSIIKFFGQKINLSEIEMETKNLANVDEAVCIHDEESKSIYLFVRVEDDFDDIKRQIMKKIQKFGVHVKILKRVDIPLTMHGKISKKDLLNAALNTNNDKPLCLKSNYLILSELVSESLGLKIIFTGPSQSSDVHKRAKGELDSSFIHLGGSSLKAIQIVDEYERITSQIVPQLLLMLLDGKVSIREILHHLANNTESNKIPENHEFESPDIVANPSTVEIVHRWKIDMKKCIDATPTVCSLNDGIAVVSVGSHSKLLFNISVSTGEIISRLELPDRIESQVIQMGECGIVGCYDGYLYCFDIRTAAIKWKFNSEAMIKCRALLIDSNVIFGNYNESCNLWCLKAENGMKIWSKKIGTKSIYANPTTLDDKNIITCSLDGTVASINSIKSTILWIFKADAPIFATPTVFKNQHDESQIILPSVDGKIHILNSDGVSTWNHQINGNIFSSAECFQNSEENCMNFVVGSQNYHLYCFKLDSNNECKEMWKHKTTASIRSSPIFIRKEQEYFVLIFSSDGMVRIINCDNGVLENQSKIQGDVFSTPVLHDQSLFVGSRNDFLYCINLNDLI